MRVCGRFWVSIRKIRFLPNPCWISSRGALVWHCPSSHRSQDQGSSKHVAEGRAIGRLQGTIGVARAPSDTAVESALFRSGAGRGLERALQASRTAVMGCLLNHGATSSPRVISVKRYFLPLAFASAVSSTVCNCSRGKLTTRLLRERDCVTKSMMFNASTILIRVTGDTQRDIPAGGPMKLGSLCIAIHGTDKGIWTAVRAAAVATASWAFASYGIAADLAGTSRDPSGHIRAGVPVQLSDAQDRVLRTTTTTGAGEFAFVGIEPGQYKLKCRDSDNTENKVPVDVAPGMNRADCRRRP